MNEPGSIWQVLIQRRAEKALRRLDKPLRQRIREAINHLVVNPRPAGCKKLTGYENLYRLRLETGEFPMRLKRTS